VERADVEEWFARYLDTYAACGRGEVEDVERLLEHYAVPLLLTADAGVVSLTTGADVVAAARQQIEGMRAAGYDRSEVLDLDVSVLNATTALVRGRFARLRSDGSEIERLRTAYLVVDGAQGRRIAALVVEAA
jgi:hypothetical protein